MPGETCPSMPLCRGPNISLWEVMIGGGLAVDAIVPGSEYFTGEMIPGDACPLTPLVMDLMCQWKSYAFTVGRETHHLGLKQSIKFKYVILFIILWTLQSP